ncbi:MAG: SulP family inorganic anion transporter [Alphaproteobacteria bacterium]|nr:SulP family inorganic anion transporter [Alphaproteobacteria bacterium]
MRQPKILTTLQTYTLKLFASDALAGLTVAMVAIPLSIALAVASGATPAQGLTTAIVAGFFISLLGGSRVQIGGPTGAFIVVVFGVIAEHGYDGLVLATLLAGLILLLAGFLRIGNLISYVPEAVVSGFTIGIAIIIATSQLKDFMGLSVETMPADFLEKLPVLWQARDSINLSAVSIALVTLVLIVVLRRVVPRFPGLIVAIAIGSAFAVLFEFPVETITSKFGGLPRSLPLPALPAISMDKVIELLPSAMVIAFLAGVESLLSAIVADRMVGGRHRPNAEVMAQGFANIASSMFGGLPATGAIARTATNVQAGGRTPVAGLLHAFFVLVIMMLIAPLAGYMAMPALAALLILIAWNMSEPQCWKAHLTAPLQDRLLLLSTLILTVLVDLTVAIGVGVAIGLALRLRKRKPPKVGDLDDWTTPSR